MKSVRAGCALAVACGVIWLPAQSAGPLAAVRVVVEAKAGEFISGLGLGDFDVVLDGKPAVVVSTSTADEPASILLLLDTSESATWGWGSGGFAAGPTAVMTGHDSLRTRSAINAALAAHLPTGDRLRVGAFSGRELLLSERYTAGKQEQRDDFKLLSEVVRQDKLALNEPSPIWDMVIAGSALLAREPEPRALILISDGEALGNRYGLEDAAREAVKRHVTVHTLAQTPDSRLDAPNGEGVMRRLAAQTGGLFRTDETGVFTIEVNKFLKHFIAATHGSYLLRVAMPDSRAREVTIRTGQPGVQVHAPRWATSSGVQ